MFHLFRLWFGAMVRCFYPRQDLLLENLALRQRCAGAGSLGARFIQREIVRILHVNVIRHPTSRWIVQQLREASPYQTAPRFLIFDHDQKYGLEVPATVRSMKMAAVQTAAGKSFR